MLCSVTVMINNNSVSSQQSHLFVSMSVLLHFSAEFFTGPLKAQLVPTSECRHNVSSTYSVMRAGHLLTGINAFLCFIQMLLIFAAAGDLSATYYSTTNSNTKPYIIYKFVFTETMQFTAVNVQQMTLYVKEITNFLCTEC